MPLPRALAPLRSPAYRRLAASLALSLVANGSWAVTVVWQVVALGGGPAELSLVGGLSAAGTLGAALPGGVLADRVPQRHLLLAVTLLSAVPVAAVGGLSLAGALPLPLLAVAGLLGGVALGLHYPAYSALVPALLPPEQVLAANGLEGAMRPALYQVAGPAAAGLLVAALSPGAALLATAAASLGATLCVLGLPLLPVRRGVAAGHPAAALLADLREGLAYLRRTRWLLATLLFASLVLLLTTGPLQVLAPFALRDRAGGGPLQHALVLAAFGVGGALGSLVVASRPLPRRYLTTVVALWALGCLPLAVFGTAERVWPMVAAGVVAGAGIHGGLVVWGTLLQRRVPAALLGRVSSLDFVVSGALVPVSVALAGPLSEGVGLSAAFLAAGLAPPVLAVVVLLVARLPADERASPLDDGAPPRPGEQAPAGR
ncbi:putative MFS family arabinose efflux permease [Geodermatophilus tzadiensis]|uniref:Putative MFS family arabinose efflux permease n=1 Tax=Geodermatophilus tzadiensis TaxID=1137988 RepID=A0A2T0U050_9ACTN|nr:MFS transporter [Geodermatophilus tzadiensis]PRY51294.1 putative MFS family arabinose efflux permease [Geodermatophilus tzadiensis]